MKNKNKYEVGQFVRWYEAYAEGIMGKDAGYGVVTGIRKHHAYNDYITYNVLRNKHGDVMVFEEGYIESKDVFDKRMVEEKEKSEQEINDSVRS